MSITNTDFISIEATICAVAFAYIKMENSIPSLNTYLRGFYLKRFGNNENIYYIYIYVLIVLISHPQKPFMFVRQFLKISLIYALNYQ